MSKYRYAIEQPDKSSCSMLYRIHPDGNFDIWNSSCTQWIPFYRQFLWFEKSNERGYWYKELTEEQVFLEIL